MLSRQQQTVVCMQQIVEKQKQKSKYVLSYKFDQKNEADFCLAFMLS